MCAYFIVHKHLHLNTNAHRARINTPPTLYKRTIAQANKI